MGKHDVAILVQAPDLVSSARRSASASATNCSGFSTKRPGRQGSWTLLGDGFASLLRQWILRSGFVWKLPLIAIGALIAPVLGLGLLPVLHLASSNIRIHSLESLMMLTALCSMLVITLTLILCVLWFRFIQKHRA